MRPDSRALRPARGPVRGEMTVRTIVKGKNIDVPDHVRRYAERKLGRLERILDDRSDALVELSIEQHRSAADSHIVEVTLVIDGKTLRSTRRPRRTGPASTRSSTSSSGGASTTSRSRASGPARTRRRPSSARSPTGPPSGRERRIVKSKRFAIEPMFEEDALAGMEELGHQFFVFVNAETERVHILYRRQDGNSALIEPVVAGEYTKGRGGRIGRTAATERPALSGRRLRGRVPAGRGGRGSARR